MVSRRSVLLGIGGVALVGVSGGTLFATTRTPTAALAPWQDPGALAEDPRIKALEWAVLAPNPHNRQPWLMELVGEDEARLYCDLDRRLPMTDPFDRQVTIGLGCFLELFAMAAASAGSSVTITPFPDGAPPVDGRLDGRPVAHLKLARGGARQDPLFGFAAMRRSNKEAFDGARPVSPSTIDAVRTAAGVPFSATVDRETTQRLKTIAWDAWQTEASTPRTHKESVDLMRIGKSEINANPDGIDLGGAFLESLSIAGLLTRKTLADPSSMATKAGRDRYEAMIESAGGFVWTVSENDRPSQLAAGRDWLRINLAATGAGLAIHPLSQCLQEFAEMKGAFEAAHDSLGVEAPKRIQMLARVGYGEDVPPSPRWPAATRII